MLRLCSALLQQKNVVTTNHHSRDVLGGRHPGEWLPLPGWKKEGGQLQTEHVQGLCSVSQGGAFQGGDFQGGDW